MTLEEAVSRVPERDINGPAVGVGATMTLPMDIRLAAEEARFGFVFARREIVPEAASSWFLSPRGGDQPRDGVGGHRARVRRRGGARDGLPELRPGWAPPDFA